MIAKHEIRIRLSDDDLKLCEELVKLTGAYSISEAVRDAVRLAYKRALVMGSAPKVSEERIA